MRKQTLVCYCEGTYNEKNILNQRNQAESGTYNLSQCQGWIGIGVRVRLTRRIHKITYQFYKNVLNVQ